MSIYNPNKIDEFLSYAYDAQIDHCLSLEIFADTVIPAEFRPYIKEYVFTEDMTIGEALANYLAPEKNIPLEHLLYDMTSQRDSWKHCYDNMVILWENQKETIMQLQRIRDKYEVMMSEMKDG